MSAIRYVFDSVPFEYVVPPQDLAGNENMMESVVNAVNTVNETPTIMVDMVAPKETNEQVLPRFARSPVFKMPPLPHDDINKPHFRPYSFGPLKDDQHGNNSKMAMMQQGYPSNFYNPNFHFRPPALAGNHGVYSGSTRPLPPPGYKWVPATYLNFPNSNSAPNICTTGNDASAENCKIITDL